MKIEYGWKPKKVDDLDDGTLFYYRGEFYIATDTSPDHNVMRYCLALESGVLDTFMKSVEVLVVEDVTLKIGGYYNDIK